MLNDDFELLYAKGQPFHAPGTKIYEEADGEMIFECPHCGCKDVPSAFVKGLRQYAQKRLKG